MKNKKKIEQALFGIVLHVRGCDACFAALMGDDGSGATTGPYCTEYQRLKARAKELAK